MRSDPISSELFIRNRLKFRKLLPVNTLAVACSNQKKARNGDQFYPYRQHSDFFYLSGITREESLLIISDRVEILFIKRPDPKTLLWSGTMLTLEEGATLSGIKEVRWLDEVDTIIEKEVKDIKKLLLSQVKDVQIYERISSKYPFIEKASLEPLMTGLRMIKEPEEIEEIRKACGITRSAFFRVLQMLKPGLQEYEVEAELIAEFIRKGAMGHAFEPIIASGSNALVMHYVENDQCLCEGDLVLLDFGAEINNYAADCSRTLPVSGRFSDRQRALYASTCRVFMKAREMMKPGIIMADFHRQVGELWEEEHIALGLYSLKDARDQSPDDPLWKKYYMHGTSHSLGMDVHDPLDRSAPFVPGMVLTCEPGIYIREEGVGIRLENDILITGDGHLDLMADIPMEAKEIEDLMSTK